jgi:epoxyqueuosine reductase QueG
MGYLAAAPVATPYFEELTKEDGRYSNWSERHIAYAAGLGTFSLSDGFITERGIAHRCGSVITDLKLPPSPRKVESPYSNCLFYANGECRACIMRCPAGAISEKGHDKIKCQEYMQANKPALKEEYRFERSGCGLCQTKVPCEFKNPVRKLKN